MMMMMRRRRRRRRRKRGKGSKMTENLEQRYEDKAKEDGGGSLNWRLEP